MGLQIQADLEIEVDGIKARLVDDGPDLVLVTEQPLALLRAAGPRSLAAVPRLIASAERRTPSGSLASAPALRIRGPHGDVAHLRAGASAVRTVSVRPTKLLPPPLRLLFSALLGAVVLAGGAALASRASR